MMKSLVLSFLLLVGMGVAANAGSEVSVRLVAILPGPSSDSSGVNDVLDVLKNNIGENRYLVSAEDKISLPADNQIVGLAHVTLTCSGTQKNFQISVSTKGKQVINTNVELEDNKPFILGGTAGKKNKFVLVFVAK
jgi:hypothetical protein